ncbi:MAG: choline transporter [Candidatus Marinimicrobia bacterium]|nr:choline transporter [Candidatus Neomarinimicrobiota bacterium]
MHINNIKTNKVIFYASLIVLFLFTVPLIIWSDESYQFLAFLKTFFEDMFGSIYQTLTILVMVFVLWLAFSKHGQIKLGEGGYHFNTFSWASMLFCAGVATGILYWGTIEWAYYYETPPFGITPRSDMAIEYAATYGMFHWGLAGRAFYCLPAIALSYVYYVKRVPLLRISNSCRGLLGRHADGVPGQVIDVLFMVGLLGSTGTSMGLGTPMIAAGVESIFGVSESFSLKVLVILFCATIFSISVYLGLNRGIKRLSNFNTTVAFIFLAFIFLAGPTVFILKMSLNSFGLMLQNFIRMLTWTDPLTDSRFVEDWSIFYWSWWIAVGPFNGIFITKISGGRSIRQVILGTMLFGSIGCAVFYNILGNYALHLELTGDFLTTNLIQIGKGAQAISGVIGSLPGGQITLLFFTIMSVVFMATTFDSSSYALASCASEKLEAHQEPARWQRLFWAFTLIILPLSLIYIGGLDSLKLAVLVSALPLTIVYVFMGISLTILLKKHRGNNDISE